MRVIETILALVAFSVGVGAVMALIGWHVYLSSRKEPATPNEPDDSVTHT